MKRLALALFGLLALGSLVFPTTALAYSNADFRNPKAFSGGSWLGRNSAQHDSYEPLNVIISARSDSRVKDDPTGFLYAAGFSDCFGGQTVRANVDGSFKGQAFEYRDGGCVEAFTGGNHLRGWKQGPTGAWFFAVSEEHGPPTNHVIDANGFNKGRDDFAAKVNGTIVRPAGRYTVYRFHTIEEVVPGCPPSPNPRPPSLYCAGTGRGDRATGIHLAAHMVCGERSVRSRPCIRCP